MASLSFDRSPSLHFDYRSIHPTLTPSHHHGDDGTVGSRLSYAGHRNSSRSPSRASSVSNRYGFGRNLASGESSLNFYDNVSSSGSRDRPRRFSTAGHFSLDNDVSAGSFVDFSASSSLSRPSRRSYVHSSAGLEAANDFVDKYSSPSSVYSDVFLPSYTSRATYTPSISSVYSKTYSGLGSGEDFSTDYKRRSYAADTLPFQRAHSYHRYNLSTPGYSSNDYTGPRSRSMSRFSCPRFTSVEPRRNFYSTGLEDPEPIQAKLLVLLNKYSDRNYEIRNPRDSMSSPNRKWWNELDDKKDHYADISRYKKDHYADISRYKRDEYESPGLMKHETLNDIQNDKDWLFKDRYIRRPNRPSDLYHSYSNRVTDNLRVPDALDSLSRRTTPRSSVAMPEIRIDDENLKSDVEHLLEEKGHTDISNRELTRLLKTNNPEDLTQLVLDAGESFRPNEISTTILPSGEKALVMTQTKQTAMGEEGSLRKSISPGDRSSQVSGAFLSPTYESNMPPSYQEQEWANEEIDKFTQLTEEYEESLQTLEHFIARNRCLFPENLLIYQKIVYYKSAAGELISQNISAPKRFSFAEDSDICAVKVREKLVLPHGCRKNGYDVMDMLKRCYPRYEEIEVVYDDEENIKEKLLRQEHGKINPFDDDFDHPTKSYVDRSLNVDATNEAYSDEDELLERCRRDDEGLPYFVTKPKSQTIMTGQSVRFTCSVAGNPEPEVVWYKNGLPIPKDGRFIASNNYGICSLRINSIRPDDKGVYTVEIENPIGSVIAEVRLEILSTDLNPLTSSLAFTRTPPYYVHMSEGDPLTLRCILQGERKPKITWYKVSREICAGEKYRLVEENDWQNMMQIRRLEMTDGGLYTVLADDGISSVRHSIEVNVAPKRDVDDTITEYEIVRKIGHIKMPPTFVKELPLQYRMKEGSSLLIGCKMDESESQAYVMGVEIVEKKKNRDSETSDKCGTPTLLSPSTDNAFSRQ